MSMDQLVKQYSSLVELECPGPQSIDDPFDFLADYELPVLVALKLDWEPTWKQLETILTHIYAFLNNMHLSRGLYWERSTVLVESMSGELRDWTGKREMILMTADEEPPDGHKVIIYEHVALGGTFDHLHAGHKILLTMAAFITSKRLVVGVTDDSMLGKKQHKELLQSLDERLEAVRKFVKLIKPSLEVEAVPIHDVYGPTATDAAIQALVVSEETKAGGKSVNDERERRGLKQLDVHVIDLIDDGALAATDEKGEKVKMGSTAIRTALASAKTAEA